MSTRKCQGHIGIVALSLALALSPLLAQAGTRLKYGPPDGAAQHEIEFGSQAVRMSQPAQTQWLLYRDDEKNLYIINDQARSYQRVNPALLAGLKNQIDMMQKQIDAQLAMLPPEQRSMMQSMLPKVPDFSPKTYSLEWSDTVRTVGAYQCRGLLIKESAQVIEETCLARAEDLKLSQNELRLMQSMGHLLGQMAGNIGAGPLAAVMEKAMGVPVEHRDPQADKARVVLLEHAQIKEDPARFQVPDAYAETVLLPGMGK